MARSKVERSRRGKPLLSGESDPVAEPCGAGGGQALGRRCGRKGLRPLQPWGRARHADAEYQPGYDGLPVGAQGLRALASMTIRTLSGSTKLATKFATKLLKATSNSRKTTTLSRS